VSCGVTRKSYDLEYRQQDLFGKPYEELVDFFANCPRKGRVLDLGCGQGRDSLILAKLGYDVTGVDLSKVGISQMLQKARKLNLAITGIVADIFTFSPERKYDIILMDSVLHFYKKDIDKETKFLLRMVRYLKRNGVVCIFIHRSKPRETHLKSIFKKSNMKWRTLIDRYIEFVWQDKTQKNRHHCLTICYYMLVLKKSE
jgi:tellurite methyltransferase